MTDDRAIRPEDIDGVKLTTIPDCVFEVINKLIAKNYNLDSKESRVLVFDIVESLTVDCEIDRNSIFDNHYLDVEGIYRERGWTVVYDQPAYNETFQAYFIFKNKRK